MTVVGKVDWADKEQVRAYRREKSKGAHKRRDPEKLKAAKRRHYLKHREQILASNAAYRQANPEKVRAGQKAAVAANREYYRQYQASYNKAHSAEKVAYARGWAERNPERFREIATATNLRRRAKAGGYLSAADIRSVRAVGDGVCSYCLKRAARLEIDHVLPIARGGANAPENCVMACRNCNAQKSAKTPLEWVFSCP